MTFEGKRVFRLFPKRHLSRAAFSLLCHWLLRPSPLVFLSCGTNSPSCCVRVNGVRRMCRRWKSCRAEKSNNFKFMLCKGAFARAVSKCDFTARFVVWNLSSWSRNVYQIATRFSGTVWVRRMQKCAAKMYLQIARVNAS